jgi:serine protease
MTFTGRLALLSVLLAAIVTAAPARAGGELAPVAAPDDEAAWDIPSELAVDFADDLPESEISALFRVLAAPFRPTALAPETRIYVAGGDASRFSELAAKLAADPRVEVIEPHARVRALFVPDDPLLEEQWHLDRVGAGRAWDFSTGRGVTVAVVDTGIACEDFDAFTKATDLATTRCVGGYNFVARSGHANDDNGHGTHVAGTIAQSTNNALGGAGVAFDGRLMPVKVLSGDGWGTTSDVADGIRWAADHGAQVINLSLGGPRNSRILQRAIDHARRLGTVVVAAAGNSRRRVEYPGGSAGVIGVSATDSNDRIAWFSSRGPGVDIAAPGVDVIQQSICNRGRDRCERFPSFSGTSMASPHVAGTAALLVSLGVTHPEAVERTLRATARSAGPASEFGDGILHSAAAVERAALTHLVVRVLALAALIFVVFRGSRKRGALTSPWSPAFLIPAFAAGPGLLFFAPFLLPRHHGVVDFLARPIGDWDLLLSAGLHGYLPLANALIPFALVLLFLSVRRLTPVLAGFSVGTAAYLCSVAVLRDVASPGGTLLLTLWCGLNAVACYWLARVVIRPRNAG